MFAPTDAAFARLPEGTIEALLADPKKLATILSYHIVPGRVLSTDIPVMKKNATLSVEPKTVEGSTLRVARATGGAVSVNGANVVKADIIAGNGVIHVIDAVVLPTSND